MTGSHSFWAKDRGWVAAKELQAGDEVYTLSGGWLRVSSGTWTGHTKTVYNLEVGQFHTYFVGDDGVWVHNICGDKPSSPGKMDREIKRGQAPRGVDRVDSGHVPGQEPHVHYSDGTSSTVSGRVHDLHKGIPNPSGRVVEWLLKHGWTPPR